MAEREIEKWITVNGARVPIYKGESQSDAVNRAIANKNEDIKEKQIADRKKESDELNKKSIMSKNASALGIDIKKNAEKLIKEYESKKAEYDKTPDSQVDKKAELKKWLTRSQKAYDTAKSNMK